MTRSGYRRIGEVKWRYAGLARPKWPRLAGPYRACLSERRMRVDQASRPRFSRALVSADEAAEPPVRLLELGGGHRRAAGERRRGHAELLQLVEQLARARRLRRLVHAVQGARLLAQQVLGHGLVGGEHELLDQRVRGRLGARRRSAQRARVVERVLGLERADGERPAGEAPAAQHPGELGGQQQLRAQRVVRRHGRVGHVARRLRPAGDEVRAGQGGHGGLGVGERRRGRERAGGVVDPLAGGHAGRPDHRVREPVGEPVVAADERAVVLRARPPPPGVEGELDGDALARLPGHQAAEVAAERRREHGLGEQRQVEAGGAAARLALDLAVVVDEVRDVGDVHVGAVALALARDRDGVVEVARGVGVDGERGQRREVAAAVVGARGAPLDGGRLLQHGVGEPLAHALGVQQRAQDGRDVVGGAEDLDDPAAVAVRGHGEHEVVEPGRRAALGDEVGALVGEEGLERPELAPAGDAVRQWPGAVLGFLRTPRRAHRATSPGRRCTAARAAARRPSWSWGRPPRRCRA